MSEFYDYLISGKLNEAMGPDSHLDPSQRLDKALMDVSQFAKRIGATRPDEAMGMLKAGALIAQAVNSPLFMKLFHDHPLPSSGGYDKFGFKSPPSQEGGTGI